MTLEKRLISKSYYKVYLEDNQGEEPIKVLAERYHNEQLTEDFDLSFIRFAQGEVYFENKDYEAAIFKWETINNELKPWAQFNIADAHYELAALSSAEKGYKAIETDSDVLKTEVLLQLFSLYIKLDKTEIAVASIKKAVDLNPDYPEVTDMARAFFESNRDFDSAIALAVKEVIRTKSVAWIGFLESYIKGGHTVEVEPNYFSDVLMSVYNIDHANFERLTVALWQGYKQNDLYVTWLKEINYLVENIEPGYSYNWKDLSYSFKETYVDLINGQFLIKELSELIPDLLRNWLKIVTKPDAVICASAVLAWNDIFPSQLNVAVVSEAQSTLNSSTHNPDIIEEALDLFESMSNWANKNDLFVSKRIVSMINEVLDDNEANHRLLITGTAMNGKAAFVNTMLNEEILEELTSSTILFKDADHSDIQGVTDEASRNIVDLDDFRDSIIEQQAFIQCNMPIPFLNENKLAIIDTPVLVNQRETEKNLFPYLRLANSVLFVLNANSSLTGAELDMAIKIKEEVPDLPIHFLISKMSAQAESKEAMELAEQTTAKINAYFPSAKVFIFTENDQTEKTLDELAAHVRTMTGQNLEATRTNATLYYIKESIYFLLDKRVKMEKTLIDNREWKEEIVAKLNGMLIQLSDMEENQVRIVKNLYSKIIEDVRQDIINNIPELLQSCNTLINDESNFGDIHVVLNAEMNKRITLYLEETVMPKFQRRIQGWIAECGTEFKDSQLYLAEMSESFNQMYGDEKLRLDCDFGVLDDWRRDVNRMTRGSIDLEQTNILMRSTASQFLLKSTGKLFGALSQNNERFHNKYKQYVENKDYTGTVEVIADNFIYQFELFEKYLERDISMFFKNPIGIVNQTLTETTTEIEEIKDSLSNMQENPEIYSDPLTLFTVRLRQYEWMATERNTVHD